ncbi:66f914a2-fb88-433b-8676-5e76d9090495 [Thermothielavioides terrestris]|uniref:66f914a2-fb88-433b-8676-5e76d9090495 n=1 Tax=Thermothielavioides terrestris TaxID=2587410 RepID=A0A3S4AJZ7_9PEZI|nr:66f914a2-fb88-433b-8676-5e76d9090495 [Thermothielavioides terrestris]
MDARHCVVDDGMQLWVAWISLAKRDHPSPVARWA